MCPFVSGSLKNNCIYIRVVKTDKENSKEKMKEIMMESLSKFEQLEPINGKSKIYKAVVMVFPDITISDAHELIDQV